MKTDKFLVFATTTLILTFSSVTSTESISAPVSPSIQSIDTSNIRLYEVESKDRISPHDTEVIPPVTHTGAGAYTGMFTAHENNGHKINMWIQNNGGTTVYVTIKLGSSNLITSQALSSESQKTWTAESMLDDKGISGDFEIYVTTSDGSDMNINVAAGQY